MPNAKPESNPAPSSDLSHRWIVAATIEVDHSIAVYANFRQSFRIKKDQRVDTHEVYSHDSRRPHNDKADLPCSAKVNHEHLIGGDQSVRVKRKTFELPPGVVTTPVPGPRINRRGIDAYIRGEI